MASSPSDCAGEWTGNLQSPIELSKWRIALDLPGIMGDAARQRMVETDGGHGSGDLRIVCGATRPVRPGSPVMVDDSRGRSAGAPTVQRPPVGEADCAERGLRGTPPAMRTERGCVR